MLPTFGSNLWQFGPADGWEDRKGSSWRLLLNTGDYKWLEPLNSCTNKRVPPAAVDPPRGTLSYLGCSNVQSVTCVTQRLPAIQDEGCSNNDCPGECLATPQPPFTIEINSRSQAKLYFPEGEWLNHSIGSPKMARGQETRRLHFLSGGWSRIPAGGGFRHISSVPSYELTTHFSGFPWARVCLGALCCSNSSWPVLDPSLSTCHYQYTFTCIFSRSFKKL